MGMTIFFFISSPLFSQDFYEINHEKLVLLSKEIAHELEEYKKTLQTENKILSEFNTVEFELDNGTRRISVLERQKISLKKEIDILQNKQNKLEKEIAEQNKLLQERLPVMAYFGSNGFLEVLFGSTSYSDLVRRRYILEHIVRYDLKTFETQLEAHGQNKKLTELLSQKMETYSKLQTEARSKNVYLVELRRQKEILLADIQKRKEVYERYLKDMDQAYAKLEQVVKKLEGAHIIEEMKDTKNIELFKGKISKPLEGTILKSFGFIVDSRTQTKLPHRGLLIASKKGTPVSSIFPGVVLFSDWFSGYGNLVIVDHGKGYVSLYAHLDKRLVKTGDIVDLRQNIGTTGDTGSLKESSLYFEIREKGRAVDPEGWLRKSDSIKGSFKGQS